MATIEETRKRLAGIPKLTITPNALLSEHTRFGIGGPADILVEAPDRDSFIEALRTARASGLDFVVIGGGSNLVVADAGFRGVVLKLTSSAIAITGSHAVCDAGTVLQTLVDHTGAAGLRGLETMTGIPGWVGAAVYGNAGAYGHSISEVVHAVTFYDGEAARTFTNAECHFRYRESIFKQRKDWLILSVDLALAPAPAEELQAKSAGILAIRNEKYPPTMKCAGSIFKNFLLAELPQAVARALPPAVIREGKVPSAYFLEQVGAKGMSRGDIRVATYHANLIYNEGYGTAADLRGLISELQHRIDERFQIPLEEEVQYVG